MKRFHTVSQTILDSLQELPLQAGFPTSDRNVSSSQTTSPGSQGRCHCSHKTLTAQVSPPLCHGKDGKGEMQPKPQRGPRPVPGPRWKCIRSGPNRSICPLSTVSPTSRRPHRWDCVWGVWGRQARKPPQGRLQCTDTAGSLPEGSISNPGLAGQKHQSPRTREMAFAEPDQAELYQTKGGHIIISGCENRVPCVPGMGGRRERRRKWGRGGRTEGRRKERRRRKQRKRRGGGGGAVFPSLIFYS